MKPKISLITLGVQNLLRSIEFYKKLGFQLETKENTENIAFFFVEDAAARLALFPREELAKDAKISAEGNGFSGFSLAHNVASEAEVDATIQEALYCGAKLIKAPEKVFWGGYSGYFADPDGFLWEVAFNPFMDLT